MRWTKWVAPMAALVLMAGIQAGQTANAAASDTPAPDGKATVTVTVVDADGKPVVGAKVSILPAPLKKAKGASTQPADGGAVKRERPVAIETGTTGADGTFALTKIPDGDFAVTAVSKESGRGRSKVTVADDKDQAVSITLKPGKVAAGKN